MVCESCRLPQIRNKLHVQMSDKKAEQITIGERYDLISTRGERKGEIRWRPKRQVRRSIGRPVILQNILKQNLISRALLQSVTIMANQL